MPTETFRAEQPTRGGIHSAANNARTTLIFMCVVVVVSCLSLVVLSLSAVRSLDHLRDHELEKGQASSTV